jgi:hypothetical protein
MLTTVLAHIGGGCQSTAVNVLPIGLDVLPGMGHFSPATDAGHKWGIQLQ